HDQLSSDLWKQRSLKADISNICGQWFHNNGRLLLNWRLSILKILGFPTGVLQATCHSVSRSRLPGSYERSWA
ncbi:hypothetical protein NPIL_343231, partial [Nephila pilipes]